MRRYRKEARAPLSSTLSTLLTLLAQAAVYEPTHGFGNVFGQQFLAQQGV